MTGVAGAKGGKPATLRLVFSLDRAEDPRLYDDLLAMRKGVKRTARLRLLAHDGLLLQQGMRISGAESLGIERAGRSDGTPMATLTNQVFGPPADE